MKQKLIAGLCLSLLTSVSGAANQIIIKFKPTLQQQKQAVTTSGAAMVRQQLMQPLTASRLAQLTSTAGVNFSDVGALATGGRVVAVDHNLSASQLQQVLAKLKNAPNIEYVEENKPVHRLAMPVPNSYQWDMYSTTTLAGSGLSVSGDSFFVNESVGAYTGQGVTVAVVDTGYVPHPAFLNRLVATGSGKYGYTFISDCRRSGTCAISTPMANAGQAPFVDALDQGDGLRLSDYQAAAADFQAQCNDVNGNPELGQSVWHGTHVTGIIAAQGASDPSSVIGGTLGGAYQAQILPVRVLGKCGGSEADVINGMLWAAGIHVAGVPDNPTPAKVINLSLGGNYSCPLSYQDAINAINATGAAIVVAAGNDGLPVTNSSPANCANVISVAALTPYATVANYSNYGDVTIAAAGGDNSGNNSAWLLSTYYNSSYEYSGCNGSPACFNYAYLVGTSMATPHVTAAVADLLSANSTLTLSQIIQLLRLTASPVTANSNRPINAGRLNTRAALNYLANSVKLLTPSTNAITSFSDTQPSQSITFTNPNDVAIDLDPVNPVRLSGPNAASFSISKDHNACSGTIAAGGNCSVIIDATPATSSTSYRAASVRTANLTLYNKLGFEIATVNLTSATNDTGSGNQISSSSSFGKAGGCSMISDGDDASLSLIMLATSIGYWARRRKLTDGSN